MIIKSRYDIILDRPGREVIEEPKPKPPDVSFLSDREFVEFVQEEINRREKINNTVFRSVSGMTGIGTFFTRDQINSHYVTGYAGIRGYAGVTAVQGVTAMQGVTAIQGYRGYSGLPGSGQGRV